MQRHAGAWDCGPHQHVPSTYWTGPWPTIGKVHEGSDINIPWHVDFTLEFEHYFCVLDRAVAVCDGVTGVELQTENMCCQANKHEVDGMC